MLLLSTVVTAARLVDAGVRAEFTTFLIGWAVQGAYVVWLPLEIAIIHRRTAGTGRQSLLTRRAAAILVGALELAVIVGALTSGALVEPDVDERPAGAARDRGDPCLFVIWFGVEDTPGEPRGGFDLDRARAGHPGHRAGDGRADRDPPGGPRAVLAWLLIAAGLRVLVPFGRYEASHERPDHRRPAAATPGQWPVQLTAFLFGMSVLGAQIPLSTFARTDPEVAGYGLGADAGFVSTLIGVYVIFLAIGAFTLPLTRAAARPARRPGSPACSSPSGTRCGCRSTTPPRQALVNMAVAGLGSGALVAALPATAAAAAPPERTGLRDRHDQRDQDRRRRDRLLDLRDRAGLDRLHRRPGEGHAPLSGYLTVWAICAVPPCSRRSRCC